MPKISQAKYIMPKTSQAKYTLPMISQAKYTLPNTFLGQVDYTTPITVIGRQDCTAQYTCTSTRLRYLRYRLGNKQGNFKQCFTRSEIEPVDLIHSLLIKRMCLIKGRASVRETSIGGGQGHIRCNCRQKCTTKSCKCRKSRVLCNSKCHSDLSCINK